MRELAQNRSHRFQDGGASKGFMGCASANRDFPSTGKERRKTHKIETAIEFPKKESRVSSKRLSPENYHRYVWAVPIG